MADIGPKRWAATILDHLGIKQTPGAMQALIGWEAAEGGHWHNDARYNPLNTTQEMPGAGNTGTQGNIKQYTSWQQGVDATIKTLRNGRYEHIIRALRAGDPGAVANAIGQSPWGTSPDLIHRTIAGTMPAQASPAAGLPSGGSGAPSTTTTSRTLPGVDNSEARKALILQFLQQRHQPGALVSLASGLNANQDTPGVSVSKTVRRSAAPGAPTSGSPASGLVRLAPNANRPGVDLTPGIQRVLRQVASRIGHTLEVGTGTNHNQFVQGSNRQSDHWDGNAADLPTVPGEQNIRLGRNALIALGMPRDQAMKATGGIYNLPYGKGRRIQVIFNTDEGGDHHGHVHVGVTALRR